MRRHYIFTDKRESKKGILSAMLGAMSLISVFLTVYFTWQNHGTAYVRYGVVALLELWRSWKRINFICSPGLALC